MTSDTRRQYEMLIRARNFGKTYGQLFPEETLAQQTFADLAAAIDQAQTQQVAKTTATVSARATRMEPAREALTQWVLKIAATARVIAETNSALVGLFQVADASDRQLLTTAEDFAKNAAPFTADFVAHGMPPTFLADLQTAIDTFERAKLDRGVGKSKRMAAAVDFDVAMAAARAAIRKLDVIVANYTGLDATVREVWESERRIAPPRVQSKSAKPAVGEEATPAPAAIEEEKAA